jgi:P27 family predicted phage terminase small subunit
MTIKPPSHLQPETKEWFTRVSNDYELEEHHLKLLQLAAEAWDRCREARAQLAKEGLTVEGREGVKAHPCVQIERDSSNRFSALIKQLGLDVTENPPTLGRPPNSTRYADFKGGARRGDN